MAARFYRALESVSFIYRFTGVRSESVNAQTPTSYSSEGVVAGHSGQFTPGGYLSTVNHPASAGIESHSLPIVSPTRYQLCYRDHQNVDCPTVSEN